MKKTYITLLTIGLLTVTGLKAQSLEEGMKNLYADRYETALGIFDKLLAVNPNNIEVIYWKGQTYFDMDDDQAARNLYEKAFQNYGSAPLLLVGLGHADLLEKKTSAARQKFEEALTNSRDKKGNNPVVATAIGRANVDAKAGDYKWAVQLLEEAAASYKKNPPTETLLQLGNAYRKAGEGLGGGKAYETYKKALEVDPTFAVASVRLAKLFESQKNYDMVLDNLKDAIKRDPKFTPAYYELFYYNFFTKKYDEAESYLKKYIESKLPETEINDESYYAQLCWARGDYGCAIAKDEKVVAEMGNKAKPKVFKLLADSYYKKGDYANAKKYIDWYFAREKPEDFISFDYKLKADIIYKTGASDEEVFQNYIKGAETDTVLTSKIDFLKQGVQFFREQKNRVYEAKLIQQIINTKPDPTLNDYFDLAIAYYFGQEYTKSRDVALTLVQKYPNEVYGYEWAYNNSIAITTDTTRKIPQDSIGYPDALALYEFSNKDTVKYKKQYVNAVKFLAAYYINEAKDKDKSLEFFRKWQAADQENAESIQQFIDQIEKMPVTPKQNNPKPKSVAKSTAVEKKKRSSTSYP